jgi:serine protease AprX
MGIEDLIRLRQEKPEGDPQRPTILNISFGMPDDGDPDNPIRLALHAIGEVGVGLVAAAGNNGPEPGSVMTPSVDPWVCSVGAMLFRPFEVWVRSGRGPSKEGLVKPDLVFFGVDILTASARSDDAFEVKSGTSFATPAISGIAVLGREAALRTMGQAARGWGWVDMAAIFPAISRKPAGAPIEKDNAYGFGMPFGDLMMRQFVPQAQAMTGMAQIMGIGLMGMLMAGAVRELAEK